MVAKKTMCDA